LRARRHRRLLPRRRRGLSLDSQTTRADALAQLAARLAAAGVEDGAREAALLLRRAAALSASALIAAPDAALGAAAERVEAFVRRREAGEPLARIEGRRAFWRHEFMLTPDVLDPRADTETLVEAALAAFASRRGEALRVLDFGVGSGAILAALLGEWPNATGLGVDASPAAAAVAEANLAALGLMQRAQVRVGNWGEGLAGGYDVIVSNPPYIASGEIAGLDRAVREHDPRLALDGGPDGLDAYRALGGDIARLLAPAGRFWLEIGAGQGDAVAALLARAGLAVTERRRDLGGVERVIGGLRAEALALNAGCA
jgi:release factor glutamine methyltransferase